MGLCVPDSFCRRRTLVLLLGSTPPGRVSVLQWVPPEFLYGRATCTVQLQDSAELCKSTQHQPYQPRGLMASSSPAKPKQSPRTGLPGVDGPPACSLTAGNCRPPCRETLCWRAVPNLCSNYYSQMWGWFSKGLIVWPNTAARDNHSISCSGFFRAVEELCKGCVFLGAIVLRVRSDPCFWCFRKSNTILTGRIFLFICNFTVPQDFTWLLLTVQARLIFTVGFE